VRAVFKGRASITRRASIHNHIFSATVCYHQTAFDQLSQFNDDPGFIEDVSGSFDGPQSIPSLDL
jgi:hypothetical protein